MLRAQSLELDFPVCDAETLPVEDPAYIKKLMDAINLRQGLCVPASTESHALDVAMELLVNTIFPRVEEQSFHVSLKTDIQRAFREAREKPAEGTTYLCHDFKACLNFAPFHGWFKNAVFCMMSRTKWARRDKSRGEQN